MSFSDAYARAARRPLTETVIINSYGDTAQQVVSNPDWEAGYARYLANRELEQAQLKQNT